MFGASAASKGALRKVNQVHWRPFWGVLDRQKFARERILMEILSVFNDFIFRPERFLEGLERVLGVCSRAKDGPKGGPGKFFKFTLGPKGGSQSEKGSLIQS